MGMNTLGEIKKKMQKILMGKRTKDVFIFLFFILISSIFWFVRELEETFSTEVVVPVKLTDVPEGVIITTDVPKELRLTIHDKGVELLPLMLHSQLDTLFVSFKSFDNHEPTGSGMMMQNQLQASLKKLLPSGASIASITPDTVSFYYNRGLHRRLPVRLQGNIEAREQYCIARCSFKPDSVDIYAPLSMLDTMRAAYTEPINLKGIDKSSSQRVCLKAQRGMRVFPDTVTMSTEVDILTRQTIEVPIVGVNFPANKTLRTFPSTVRVSYLMPAGQAKNIDLSEFVVVVTYAELLENETNRCRPRLNNAPSGISGTLVDPIEVDYLLENVVTQENEEPVKKPKNRHQASKR